MKKKTFKALFLLVWAACLPAAQSAMWISEVTLSGAQETPPNSSTGTGSATIQYDDSSNAITVSGTFSGLEFPSSNAHIHGPAAAGTPAGVVFPLTFDSGVTSGSFSGSSTYTAGQETDFFAGLHYVNLHSTGFPNGELRGQITSFTLVPEPQEYAMMAAAGLMGFALWRKRQTALAV